MAPLERLKEAEEQRQVEIDELRATLEALRSLPPIGGRNDGDQKRVALVVGNNDYAELKDLDKAVGDANTISGALRDLGFSVTSLEDLGVDDFDVALANFYDSIEEGDIAFFFYAGHGIAAEGVNYLLPVDMPEIKASEVRRVQRNAIDATRIVSEITARGAQLAFVVLDACRDDPFPQHDTRGATKAGGLARMTPDPGAFVIYSAGTGQTALDRLSPQDDNPNSIFTRKFWPILTTPGMPIVEIAKRTQVEVKSLADKVKHDQAPAYYDQVIGQFYFRAPEPELYGLVIGIDDYAHLPKLRGAVNDAQLIAGVLRDAGAADVVEILDQDARPQFIEFAWNQLVRSAKPGDTLVFSYSGSSGSLPAPDSSAEADGKDELLTLTETRYDAATNSILESEVISDDKLTEWMERAAEKNLNVVLLIDGCHADGLLDRTFANISFVGASAEDELVGEYLIDDQYHGIVSVRFAEGLRGAADVNGDGFVTQKELFAFLDLETAEFLQTQSQSAYRQNPQFFPEIGDSAADLALFRVSGE